MQPAPPLPTPSTGGPIRRVPNGNRVSRFVFTLNNWTQEEYTHITSVFAPTVKWFVVGKEVGANGTPHLQGACVIGKQMSFSTLKKLPGFARAHLERMNGSPQDSLAYCTKEDTAAFQHGSLPNEGKRTDIKNAVARIKAGENLRQLANGDEDGAIAIVKFYKGLTVLRSYCLPPRTSPPIVIWLHGSTGTGKTRSAFKAGRAFAKHFGGGDKDIWISSGSLRWFDGYDSQSVAIFDDFRAKHVTSFAFLLRLLDRYPVSVEFKGGFVDWSPKVIFITAPSDPKELFHARNVHVPEDINQLMRRISKIFEFEQLPNKAERKDFVKICFELLPEPEPTFIGPQPDNSPSAARGEDSDLDPEPELSSCESTEELPQGYYTDELPRDRPDCVRRGSGGSDQWELPPTVSLSSDSGSESDLL